MHKLPVNKFSDMASVRWRKIGLTVRTKPERNRGKKKRSQNEAFALTGLDGPWAGPLCL